MKNSLFAVAVLCITWASIVLVVKYENLVALILLLIGVYFLLARLIVEEQQKSEEMMGKLNRKIRKSRESISHLNG